MENSATEWADKIEKAIKKGDWYGIGTYAGKQINKGINAVPWKKTGEAITTAVCKTLDFADGKCDNLATLTIDGVTKDINLEK